MSSDKGFTLWNPRLVSARHYFAPSVESGLISPDYAFRDPPSTRVAVQFHHHRKEPSEDGFRFTITPADESVHQIEYTESLAPADWRPLPGQASLHSLEAIAIQAAASSGQRFYRARRD